jgi:hypothetical protein
MSFTLTIRSTRILTALSLCLPLLGCFEEPVWDHLHVEFAPGSAIVVTAVRKVAPTGSATENPAVVERMDEARTDLENGRDRWGRAFPELGAIASRRTLERHDGSVRRGINSALLDSFRPVERLLANEGLGAFFDDAAGIRELRFIPTGGGQATRQQREVVEEALSSWSGRVAEYLEAAAALYSYLERAPNRAIPCFEHIFDEHSESSRPLSELEGELVLEVTKTMERVAEVLLIDAGQAYSINELSRLAFDTFQGRLTVTVDGPVIESEGFFEYATYLERPQVDLWNALVGALDQWLSPDLVTTKIRPGPDEIQPEVDPESFANQPRLIAPPPNPSTIEAELRSRLQVQDVYFVRWETHPAPDDEDEVYELALQQLANAERSLPD